MRRHGAKNADYRGGVTCLYDTQLLGACLHATECGGRSRPEAVRGMTDVPIAPPAPGPRRGGRLSALSAQPLSTGGSSKPLARRVDPVSRIVLEGSLPLPCIPADLARPGNRWGHASCFLAEADFSPFVRGTNHVHRTPQEDAPGPSARRS